MKKYISLVIAFSTLLTFCKKGDLSENESLTGRLTSVNPFTKDTSVVSDAIVYIKKEEQTDTNFLYSRATDKDGYYYFNSLDANQTYVIFSKPKVGEILYYGELETKGRLGKDETAEHIDLQLQYDSNKNNLLQCQTVDINGLPLPNVDVCFYLNPVLAFDSTCSFSNMKLTTDSHGLCNKILSKSDSGTYIVKAKTSFGSLTLKDSIYSIKIDKGLTPITLVMKK